jgi:hypothetical protein
MGKIAIVIRGGVSRESGRLLDPKSVSFSKSAYVNFEACRNSIFKNLIAANPVYDFDIFLHSWVPDIGQELDASFQPVASAHEENLKYADRIRRLSLRSMVNEISSGVLARDFSFWRFRARYAQTYAGISQALAIQKSLELMEENSGLAQYDWIILCRPDVLLLREVRLDNYDPKLIYCNGYMDRMGDFRWIFSPEYRYLFTKLLMSIDEGGYHSTHYWIRDYFDACGFSKTYVSDNIQAGVDEEVLRKVKLSGIPFTECQEFGVTEEQYLRYS